jgi:hypothetical protein
MAATVTGSLRAAAQCFGLATVAVILSASHVSAQYRFRHVHFPDSVLTALAALRPPAAHCLLGVVRSDTLIIEAAVRPVRRVCPPAAIGSALASQTCLASAARHAEFNASREIVRIFVCKGGFLVLLRYPPEDHRPFVPRETRAT